MTLPNFLIIGAAKSGTSSLYYYLKQHPEIYMSPVKEPHFFSFTSQTKMTNGPGDTIPEAITDLEEYKNLFENVINEKAIGEASTSYLYRKEASKRIKATNPDIKLIAILRNPTERAFSAYMHLIRDQREETKPFSEALKQEAIRIQNNWDPIWHYKNVGLYFEQLSRYYKIFSREQIKIYEFEQLISNPGELLQDIFSFLEVNTNFTPDISLKYNVSGSQKSNFIYYISKTIFNKPNPIRWISRILIPELWRQKVTNTIRSKNLDKQTISEVVKSDLINFYREDILKLEELIEKDLSKWLE